MENLSPFLHDLRISSLGLGASRFGSVTGSTSKEAEWLIKLALENGVTFFDTATSYGQGDSERILGKVLRGKDDLCVVSKIGKVVPTKARLLRPAKPLLRMMGRRSSNLKGQVQQSRGSQLPVCFQIPYLQKQIDDCRRRLGMTCVPMVMLHSPSVTELERGDAIKFLEKQQALGNIRAVGVSVDDASTAKVALNDSRVCAVQLPYHEDANEMDLLLSKANDCGKLIIAREIFHGVRSLNSKDRSAFITRNLKRSLANDSIGVSLVGTINSKHLLDLLKNWKDLTRS